MNEWNWVSIVPLLLLFHWLLMLLLLPPAPPTHSDVLTSQIHHAPGMQDDSINVSGSPSPFSYLTSKVAKNKLRGGRNVGHNFFLAVCCSLPANFSLWKKKLPPTAVFPLRPTFDVEGAGVKGACPISRPCFPLFPLHLGPIFIPERRVKEGGRIILWTIHQSPSFLPPLLLLSRIIQSAEDSPKRIKETSRRRRRWKWKVRGNKKPSWDERRKPLQQGRCWRRGKRRRKRIILCSRSLFWAFWLALVLPRLKSFSVGGWGGACLQAYDFSPITLLPLNFRLAFTNCRLCKKRSILPLLQQQEEDSGGGVFFVAEEGGGSVGRIRHPLRFCSPPSFLSPSFLLLFLPLPLLLLMGGPIHLPTLPRRRKRRKWAGDLDELWDASEVVSTVKQPTNLKCHSTYTSRAISV